MKDVKVSLLLVVSCLLLMAAFIVLWTWGYHSYYKDRDEKRSAQLKAKDSIAIVAITRDSLERLYAATLHRLNTTLDSTQIRTDSIQGNLDNRLREFYRLSDEVAMLLKARKPNTDPAPALRKISELQVKVDELRDQNAKVEDENKALTTTLNEITEPEPVPVIRTAAAEQKEEPERIVSFGASELRLAAVTTNNDREQETISAEKAEKIIGSFAVQNNVNQSASGDVMIVVLQPDGRVLQKSTWESGSFSTNDGKKIYSMKMQVNSSPREAKRLNFSLSSDRYQKGNYILQIYHNGKMIGRAVKTLS